MVRTRSLSAEAEKLMPVLDALSSENRIGIAGRLLADPDPEDSSPEEIEATWKAEICRRVEEIKSGKVIGIPAEEVERFMDEEFG